MEQLNNTDYPLVSVCMITYNHEPFIAEAIEGVLMQKTNFPVKLVIGEDCSTDKTRNICEKYKQQHPDLIELIPATANLGMMSNFIRTLETCKGKYIALCEGDDYWTDPHKLQKQVDFLEENEDYSFCFHNVYINQHDYQKIFKEFTDKDGIYALEDVLKEIWFIPTCSICFKNVIDEYPKWMQNAENGDLSLIFLLALKGKIKRIDGIMGFYRQHPGGASKQFTRESLILNISYTYMNFNIATDKKFQAFIEEGFGKYIKSQYQAHYKQTAQIELKNSNKMAITFTFKELITAIGIKVKNKILNRFKTNQ
ncbi:glycosyltransferase [Marinilabilia rubra]|nr:glycosyltransferase [Marinilabilia rubra]